MMITDPLSNGSKCHTWLQIINGHSVVSVVRSELGSVGIFDHGLICDSLRESKFFPLMLATRHLSRLPAYIESFTDLCQY